MVEQYFGDTLPSIRFFVLLLALTVGVPLLGSLVAFMWNRIPFRDSFYRAEWAGFLRSVGLVLAGLLVVGLLLFNRA